MTTDVLIQVQDLKKHFPGATPIKALDGVSVDIKKALVSLAITLVGLLLVILIMSRSQKYFTARQESLGALISIMMT